MANNNQSMNFTITGNSNGLVQAMNNASTSMNQFGSNVGGIAGTAANNIGGLMSKMTSLNPVMLGVAGIAATVGLAFKTLSEQTAAAMEVYQSAVKADMNSESLQQMATMFRQTGLTLDNIADQQKDLKDKLGDALANNAGSMLSDIIIPLKLNIIELQNMAKAGDDVYAKIYFAARAQGVSSSAMVNMFETLGNDATSRLSVLRQFNSEQEYQQALQRQGIALTNDQINNFRAYEDATAKLNLEWSKWKNETIAPLAETLADILRLINDIMKSAPVQNAAVATSEAGIAAVEQYQQDYQKDLLANSSIYGYQLSQQENKNKQTLDRLKEQVERAKETQNVLKTPEKPNNPLATNETTINQAMSPMKGSAAKAQDSLDSLTSRYNQLKESINASLDSAYGGDTKKQQNALAVLESNYKAQKETLEKVINADEIAAKKKAESDAKQAEQKAKQLAQQHVQAIKDVENTMSQIGMSESAVRLQRFKYQYDEMERTTKNNAKTLGLTEAETTELLKRQYESRQRAYNDMVDEMLKETDRKKLSDNLAAIGDNLTDKQRSDLLKNMNKNAGIDRDDENPFDTRGLGLDLEALQEQQNQELILNNQLLANKTLSLEQYLERKKQLEDKYNQDSMNLMVNQTTSQISMMGGMADSLGTILSGAFGKQSGAAKAAFAVSKGLAIAEAMIAIQQSVAKAMALGWPMGIAAGAQVLAQGATIVSTIKSTTVGQAHDGIDNVPNTGTWNLEKGERVVGAALNQDLSNFLKSSDDNGSTGNIEINAPLIVQGSGQLTDAEFNRMLQKHRDSLVQAVRQSQQRNS
ncbi:hypothetical protein [Candidatus Symbiopectobacterium sp. NZEC135]|uniref:hypothetical protein n=1 Tax=Candidatus Symbiopectobacterium sp. NZEC135 TaxID=2820471 RepID=UPI0022270A6F|nr:hypothetical protein [Candidatus Symbiopectobacterium sp. NZEC135]MCW2478118.1 hypothetical protein [Candidatus Symbiopectobacterium sp. NZEC135]